MQGTHRALCALRQRWKVAEDLAQELVKGDYGSWGDKVIPWPMAADQVSLQMEPQAKLESPLQQ